MSFNYIRKIPTEEEIVGSIPMKDELKKVKAKRDEELKKIIRKEDSRFIVIIGPCSADYEDSVMDYVTRLAKLNEKLKDKLYIIPRIYTNKPRTNGEGYKGMLHQPHLDLDKEPNLSEGIGVIRRLHMKVLEETGLTTADEMLYPDNHVYLDDLLGYVAVGARSVENQQHRLVSSGVNVPIGMKNPTSGNLSVMFNSIHAAQRSHEFIYHDWEVQTKGNEYTHAILRGYVNKQGQCMPNYHYEDLKNAINFYKKSNLKNETIIVDASHANSNKDYRQQLRISKEVMHSIKLDEEINKYVKGLMVESYILEGHHEISEKRVYGKSVTDGCISWETTEELLHYLYDSI